MRMLSIALLSAATFVFGVESTVAQERVVYEVDKSNYDTWYLYGMDCNQVLEIRIHVTPQWAPYQDLSCLSAFGLQGNHRVGVRPDQWVEIRISSLRGGSGNWALLEDLDRRP